MTSDGASAQTPDVANAVSRASSSQALARNAAALEPLRARPEAGQEMMLPGQSAFLPLILSRHCEAAESPFGVQVTYLYPALVDKICQGGVSWVRFPLNWSSIEPENTTPENYRWPEYQDRQIADLSARKIRTIFTIMGNPSWAATYPGGPVDRAEIDELVEFVEAVVSHYSGPPYSVKHWEFYNEPDNTCLPHAEHGGCGLFGHQPEAYTQMLAAVYGPIKAIDPEAKIIFGGLAHDRFSSDDPPGCFAKDFLDKVLEAGGENYFDIMNFHYYPGFREVWAPYGEGIAGKATSLRERMVAQGVSKPLMCTETSMWSDGLHGGSDELQSRYVAQVYTRSATADLAATVWFMLLDCADPSTWQTGLLTVDGVSKAAYDAYQTAASQLSSADYVRALSPAETGSDQIEAYEFETDDGRIRIVAAWTKDEATRTLALHAEQVEILDKFGQRTLFTDGSDGAEDGHVAASIGPSPVYLRFEAPPGGTLSAGQ